MEKLHSAEYQMGYFRGGKNTIEFVTYKDKILIPQQLQKYVVKWYHKYLLHPGLDRTDEVIIYQLYCPGIGEAVHKEFTVYDV